MTPPVLTEGLTKSFGEVVALDGVSVRAERGTVLTLLGHNGAGKTTLVNILATLLTPDAGTASVAGFDVVREPHQVRRRIGLTGQFAAVDADLSGVDNLALIARLLGASKAQARARAAELLAVFGLTDAATRQARTYSGGMRRRLDLAASLVGRHDVIFLDEPTTGLDPTNRIGLWEIVERLVDDGTTVVLTTQYLEEAERLADSITVLSGGRVVAGGTPAELKAQVGGRTVQVTLSDPGSTESALRGLAAAGLEPVRGKDSGVVSTPVSSSGDLIRVVRALDAAGVEADGIVFKEPDLNDVYAALAQGRGVREREPA